MSEALELQATSTSHARAEDKTYRLTATDSSSYQVHVYFYGINLELVHGASETRTLGRQPHDVILAFFFYAEWYCVVEDVVQKHQSKGNPYEIFTMRDRSFSCCSKHCLHVFHLCLFMAIYQTVKVNFYTASCNFAQLFMVC